MLDTLLSQKQRYQTIILEQYKDAVFISMEELMWLHKTYNSKHYFQIKQTIMTCILDEDTEPCIAYVLGAGITTDDQHCCNGIRYGEEGLYISLPQLPSYIWIPF